MATVFGVIMNESSEIPFDLKKEQLVAGCSSFFLVVVRNQFNNVGNEMMMGRFVGKWTRISSSFHCCLNLICGNEKIPADHGIFIGNFVLLVFLNIECF